MNDNIVPWDQRAAQRGETVRISRRQEVEMLEGKEEGEKSTRTF